MFQKRDPQRNLFESSNLLPRPKAARLLNSWANIFQEKALPLIDEELFAPLYCDDNGRPNKPVSVVFGVLLLKEMFNMTDEEALEQLEFNLLWHHALRLTPEEAHLCQKTLHNFRIRVMEQDLGRLAFEQTTDKVLKALGVKTVRQRLDSTHIVSNIATLTRLGLFCETIRVFLMDLKESHPRLYGQIPAGLRGRYVNEEDGATRYGDARSDCARRRLEVCARDLYRLIHRFQGTGATELESYGLLERLLEEQCEKVSKEERPGKDDDDQGEGGVPIRVKESKEVKSDSLQTPHDPDGTYSGHKGKGYEVQVAETCHEENEVEIITLVEVTDSCFSDACATLPVIEELKERGLQPDELVADTTYGSGDNAVHAAFLGTEVISPVGGSAREEETSKEEGPLSAADFSIDPAYARPSVCPAGQESIKELRGKQSDQVEVVFAKENCETCPLFSRCPARYSSQEEGYVLRVNLVKVNIEQRRRAEEQGEFQSRYSIRAGIEGTNSELKRKHGMGRLRVRKRPRVELAVYLKALACNFKRMVRFFIAKEDQPLPMAA
jgi:hypothetical protein